LHRDARIVNRCNEAGWHTVPDLLDADFNTGDKVEGVVTNVAEKGGARCDSFTSAEKLPVSNCASSGRDWSLENVEQVWAASHICVAMFSDWSVDVSEKATNKVDEIGWGHNCIVALVNVADLDSVNGESILMTGVRA